MPVNFPKIKQYYNSSRVYCGFSSSILLIKSDFSMQPSHRSSQSERIFFNSLTFSFFKSTVFKSIVFSENEIKIYAYHGKSLISTLPFFYINCSKFHIAGNYTGKIPVMSVHVFFSTFRLIRKPILYYLKY